MRKTNFWVEIWSTRVWYIECGANTRDEVLPQKPQKHLIV